MRTFVTFAATKGFPNIGKAITSAHNLGVFTREHLSNKDRKLKAKDLPNDKLEALWESADMSPETYIELVEQKLSGTQANVPESTRKRIDVAVTAKSSNDLSAAIKFGAEVNGQFGTVMATIFKATDDLEYGALWLREIFLKDKGAEWMASTPRAGTYSSKAASEMDAKIPEHLILDAKSNHRPQYFCVKVLKDGETKWPIHDWFEDASDYTPIGLDLNKRIDDLASKSGPTMSEHKSLGSAERKSLKTRLGKHLGKLHRYFPMAFAIEQQMQTFLADDIKDRIEVVTLKDADGKTSRSPKPFRIGYLDKSESGRMQLTGDDIFSISQFLNFDIEKAKLTFGTENEWMQVTNKELWEAVSNSGPERSKDKGGKNAIKSVDQFLDGIGRMVNYAQGNESLPTYVDSKLSSEAGGTWAIWIRDMKVILDGLWATAKPYAEKEARRIREELDRANAEAKKQEQQAANIGTGTI